MSYENIGVAEKNPAHIIQPEDGVTFAVSYGLGGERYGITLSGKELDAIADKGYEITMGRCMILATCGIILLDESRPHMALFTNPATLNVELKRGYPPHINLGVGIMSASPTYRVSGIAHATRSDRSEARWTFDRYEDLAQEPLRELEEVFTPSREA